MEIPTADLMLTKNISFEIGNKLHDSLDWISIVDCMKEFAKLHVQAALESAYNNAYIIEVKRVQEYDYADSSNYGVSKDSILNAYPLENIK